MKKTATAAYLLVSLALALLAVAFYISFVFFLGFKWKLAATAFYQKPTRKRFLLEVGKIDEQDFRVEILLKTRLGTIQTNNASANTTYFAEALQPPCGISWNSVAKPPPHSPKIDYYFPDVRAETIAEGTAI